MTTDTEALAKRLHELACCTQEPELSMPCEYCQAIAATLARLRELEAELEAATKFNTQFATANVKLVTEVDRLLAVLTAIAEADIFAVSPIAAKALRGEG